MSIMVLPTETSQSRSGSSGRRRWGWVAVAYLVSAILVIPIYWLLVTSLRQPAELQSATTLWPQHPNLGGYGDVLGDPAFGLNLLNSLLYGVGGALLGLVFGAGTAYAVARSRSRWATGIIFAMLVLQTFPGIMLALPLFVMFSQLGLINNSFAVIIAIATRTVPFTVLMLRPHFAGVPLAVEQAAALDGCSRSQVLWRIVLPLALPGLITVSAFNFVTGWGDLLFSLTLLSEASLQPVSLGLYRYMGQYAVDWNQLMAASVIAAIPAVIVFFSSQRFLVSGSVAGATNE